MEKEKVALVGLKRDNEYMYYVGADLNVYKVPYSRSNKSEKKEKILVVSTTLEREKGYLYFIDKDGDISRCVQARGRNKKKSTK